MAKYFSVHLASMGAMESNYQQNKEKVLNSGHRFAVIETNKITYFDKIADVYEEWPDLKPDSHVYGTHPKLVDIGAVNNTLVYRRERLDSEIEKFENNLINLLETGDELEIKEKEIAEEERKSKKR